MSLRIEKLETAETNRATEDEKKKEEPEQPIMMGQPQLMIAGSGGFAAPAQAVSFKALKIGLFKLAVEFRGVRTLSGSTCGFKI